MDAKRTTTPPRPPYATVEAFYASLATLKGSALPPRIDKASVGLGNRDGTWSHVQTTFRVLGLVTKDNEPTAALQELVDAFEGSGWPTALQKVVLPVYSAWLSGLMPNELAPTTLRNRFFQAGCTATGTLEKAVRFCQAIHNDAGVPLPRDVSPAGKPRPGIRPRTGASRQEHSAQDPVHPGELQEYPFQLRQDLVIRVVLPRDITSSEVKRFSKFLETIPLPE